MFKKRNIRAKIIKPIREVGDVDSDVEEEFNVIKPNKKIKLADEDKRGRLGVTGEISHEITGSQNLTVVEDATKENRLFAESNEDLKNSDEQERTGQDTEDGVYKGQTKYAKFIAPNKSNSVVLGLNKIGPLKAASNIRSTTTFDFAPDVCKDYKNNGYCGYGDTCKFLHSRDDVKKGWKINKEWEDVQDQKKQKIDLLEIPFNCPICKSDYKNPIITNCGHYFCESCFLTYNKKSAKCFICSKNTNGIAKPAKELKNILKGMKQSEENVKKIEV